jgi:hypothetical protein
VTHPALPLGGKPGIKNPKEGVNIDHKEFPADWFEGLAPDTYRSRHGLILVHFSAQPGRFLSLQSTETTQHIPHKVLTSRRKVDVLKVIPLVHFSARPEPSLLLQPPNVFHRR